MAQVKFYRGNASDYSLDRYREGIYFSMDEKVLYHNGVRFDGIDLEYFSGATKDFDIEGSKVNFKKLDENGEWQDVTINLVAAADKSIEIGTITNTEGNVNDGFSVKVKAQYATVGDGLKLGDNGLYVDLTQTNNAIAANTANIAANKDAIDANKAAIDTLNGGADQPSSVANKIKVAIDGLYVDAISETGKVITAISQSNGKVSATAATLGADNVAFTSSNPAFTSNKVSAALDALYAQSGEGSKVTLKSVDGTEGILKVYTIKQGVREVGTINIPKDLVVTSGSVVKGTWDGNTFTEKASGKGTALKLVIANQEAPVYINTLDLVKDHTAGNGIAISEANEISVKIDGASEGFLSVGADGVKLSGVQNAIDAASGQVNSIIEARLGTGVTSASTATDQFTALRGTDASSSADTSVIGAKKYAEGKIAEINAIESGTSAHVDVTVAQANGIITSVTVANKDIASASDLANEITNRTNAIKGISGDTTIDNGKVITAISQRNGIVSVTAATLGAENVSASTIDDDGTKVTVTGETVSEQIASLAKSIKSASTTAAAAHTVVNAKPDGHVKVTVSSENSHDVVTITEDDIASASGLTNEIAARKAIDGITGDTYSKNTEATYISGATSLNDADVKLNNQLKIVSDTLQWIDCGDYGK